MHKKLNCWEFTNCGREPGGVLADVEGVCPVSVAMHYDGVDDGRAGGRVCWKLHQSNSLGSACSQLRLLTTCQECAFFRRLKFESATEPIVLSAPQWSGK